jgi:hypothetical protein
MISHEKTSRRAHGGVMLDGSCGQGKQYHPPAEIIRMPSGSIVSIAPLEPLDLPKPRFNEALALALLLNFALWFGFALILRALFF